MLRDDLNFCQIQTMLVSRLFIYVEMELRLVGSQTTSFSWLDDEENVLLAKHTVPIIIHTVPIMLLKHTKNIAAQFADDINAVFKRVVTLDKLRKSPKEQLLGCQ